MSYCILNQVFSRKTIRDILTHGFSKTLEKAYYSFTDEQCSNIDKIKYLYEILSKEYRNEYFYKNQLINENLFDVYSVNTATAITELPIEKSIVDFILLTEDAHAFEIKTEMDTLNRLETQANDYYKVFKYVTIITVEKHLDKLLLDYNNTPIGISTIGKNNSLTQIKTADEYELSLDKWSIYKILRKSERYKIVSCFFDTVSVYDQFSEYKKLFELFNSIPLEKIYSAFINILKERNNAKRNKELIEKVPEEIKALVYFDNFSEKNYKLLNKNMQIEKIIEKG